MRKIDLGTLTVTGTMFLFATPAMAGITVTPAPVVGLGVAGIAALGVGYRMLRSRFK